MILETPRKVQTLRSLSSRKAARKGFPLIELLAVIGYQYHAGIATWKNTLGSFPSARPIKTALSKSGWMVAADLVERPDGVNWGDPSWSGGWQNLPAHRNSGSLVPAGANELFIDGSARWVKAKGTLRFIHLWVVNRELYSFQDDLGELEPKRAQLMTVP